MKDLTELHNLKFSNELADFVENELLPGLDISSDDFWASLSKIFYEFRVENENFLRTREEIQNKIDDWHINNPKFNFEKYKDFLKSINYLVEEGSDFSVTTDNVDDEIATIAGPQLVVPVMNARFALNAANARWGSLYDALYGTDMIDEADGAEKTGPYNPVRGDKVIAFAKQFLDQYFSLEEGSYTDAIKLSVDHGNLLVELQSGETTALESLNQFVGFNGDSDSPNAIL